MLKVGKLDSDVLERIVIGKIENRRPEVLVHAGVGEDCAVIDFNDYEAVLSTDPITASVNDIGRLCIHISCNDIASNGIEPVGILLAVMLPVGTTEEDIATIMGQAAEAAAECNVEIIGGHTEITEAVNQPVIVSTAIGRGKKQQSASAEKMRAGDAVLMTKTAGIEGSGIIAADYAENLREVLSEAELKEAQDLLTQVSVVKDGIAAGRVGTHGMHDVTEGGILGAVWEMCQIADVGIELWEDKIPIAPVTRKICEHFGIDCMRLISSGSMLIMAAPEKKAEIIAELEKAGIAAAEIGRIVPKEQGLNIIKNGEAAEIEPPRTDELYKVVKH